MLKYCNGCKRDLEIDNFYYYKKSTCKNCVNKEVKCDYCDKEFNSTNLSKHIKQRHSTYDCSRTNDSTSNNSSSNNSTSDKSTSDTTYKNNSTCEITISDQLYVNKYVDLLKSTKINFDIKIQTK